VRWDELFADIEGQFERQLDAERVDLAAEGVRLQAGRRFLRERLGRMCGDGSTVSVVLVDAHVVELRVDSTGADWVAGELRLGERARGAVVPIAAIEGVLPTREQLDRDEPAADPVHGLSERLGLAFILRDLCRRRIVVELRTAGGTHHGTIDRVGADHLDLAEHDPAEPRRPRAVRRMRLVPFSGILCVQT
jgi:hypothetical protein